MKGKTRTGRNRDFLPIGEVCAFLGIRRSTRDSWAGDEALGLAKGPQLALIDAIDLSVFAELRGCAGPKLVKKAWMAVRDELHRNATRAQKGPAWIVIDCKRDADYLALSPDELIEHAACGREVVILPIDARIRSAAEQFRAAVEQSKRLAGTSDSSGRSVPGRIARLDTR